MGLAYPSRGRGTISAIDMPDNTAAALSIRQGSSDYITFSTVNDAEEIVFNRIARNEATIVATAAAVHTLVFGTAGANETTLATTTVIVSFGSAGQAVKLPDPTGRIGLELRIYNASGNAGVIQNHGGSTLIATLAAGKMCHVGTNGVGWAGGASV